MDLVQLRTFAEVARLGSLSAAAGALGYSQSAVSRQLQALESDLGVALLVRGARGVRLTGAGAALRPHAQDMLRSADLARADVAEAEPEGIRLRLGCIPSATPALLAPAVARLEATRPGLTVMLRQGPSRVLAASVAARELDAAVVMDGAETPRSGLVREQLISDELRLVLRAGDPRAGDPRGGRTPAAPAEPVALAGFAAETWVENPGHSERVLITAAAQAGFVPRRLRRAPDQAAKLGFVAAGLGVALVPGLLCAGLPPGLRALRLSEAPGRTLSWLTRPERAGEPLLGQLRAELAAVAAPLQRDNPSTRPQAAYSGNGSGLGVAAGGGGLDG